MTPAEKAGWKVGDHVITHGSGVFSDGSIAELYRHNGSQAPLFKLIYGSCRDNSAGGEPGAFVHLCYVQRIEYHPVAYILQEIVDVMKAGGDPVEEFEHKSPNGGWAQPSDTMSLLTSSFDSGWKVRRKPLRVSGEIAQSDVDVVQRIAMKCNEDEHRALSALLSLVGGE